MLNGQEYGGTFKDFAKQLTQGEKNSFFVARITFTSDIPLTDYEFFYASGLKEQSFITKKKVDKAYQGLMLKKRFALINIDISDDVGGKHLHFDLKAAWIFKKVEFQGILFGKPAYAILYQQQPGAIFDPRIHEESLQAIKGNLYDQGYFSCKIYDELEYSVQYKTIVVYIHVKKGPRFKVGSLAVEYEKPKETEQGKESGQLQNKAMLAVLLKHAQQKFAYVGKGSLYDKPSIDKNAKRIRKLFYHAGFLNARFWIMRRLQPKSKTIYVTLRIKPGKRKYIDVFGNTVFSTKFIKETFVGKDFPSWLFMPDVLTQQLLHEYYKKGYWFTKVKVEKRGGGCYRIIVKEGLPVTVSSVQIIDAGQELPEKQTSVVQDMLINKTFDQDVFETSLQSLKDFYMSNGYWDFVVVNKQLIKHKNARKVDIIITINKGQQRLWGGFSLDAFSALKEHEFFRRFTLPARAGVVPFNLNWLYEQRQFLIQHFYKQGYWYAAVEPQLVARTITKTNAGPIDQNKQPSGVHLSWKIQPGSKVTFGKTVLRGATTVAFNRLKKQCSFKEGDDWNSEKLERTRKRLRQLDVFRTVNVRCNELAKSKTKKPVLITVVDDDPVEIRARLGYFLNSKNILFKTRSTPRVGASFIIKNPTNRADKLAMTGDWTMFERSFGLDYQQPSPFGVPALGVAKVYASKFDHPVEIAHSGAAYRALQMGFLTGLTDQFRENYHWRVNIGNEWHKITHVRGNLRFDENLLNIALPQFFIEPAIEVDKVDNHTDPTKGYLASILCKIMVPERDGDVMTKVIIDQSVFVPLFKKMVLAGHLRIGHILGRHFDRILPTERFYLGGPYTVRGYELNALPPFGEFDRIDDEGNTVKGYTVQGASSMVNTNVELRVPIYGSLGGVIFQDMGILSQSGVLGLKGRWYPGSGFGLRYKTPIGSLRLDIGWKWKKRMKEDSQSYAIYLTFGEAF